MNNFISNLVDHTVQCYGCPIFDRMFQIVSNAAASIYDNMALIMSVVFCVLFSFFVLNAVWQNIKKGSDDPWYQKSVRPAIINSLIALTLLFSGLSLPRFISQITFEPVAEMATVYTQSMLNIDSDVVNEKVTYQPEIISDDGFFRPQLRDKIIILIKTTITQFQSYMKIGLVIIDTAITWRALLGVGALIKHIILLIVGIYLFYGFFKLFFKFCCYFIDIIVEMALFAFLFPVSLVLAVFQGPENVPSWLSGLGKNLGGSQIKNLINAIVALSAAVITYTVIMMIIASFFATPGASMTDIMNAITTGDIFDADLSGDNMLSLTLMGMVALVYVINFIQDQIPQVTKMIMDAFNVNPESKAGDKIGTDIREKIEKDIGNLYDAGIDKLKQVGKTAIAGGEIKEEKKDAKK